MRQISTLTQWRYLLTAVCIALLSTQGMSQLNCNNTNGNSYNAVTGIQAWTFDHTGNAGNFAGNSAANGDGDANSDGDISSNSNAWGLYANGGGIANQIAVFDIPFVTGDEIKLDVDNGYIDNGSTVGFGLQNENGENLLEFYFTGGASSYTINGNTGPTPTSIGFTDEGLALTLTLNTSTEIEVSITELITGATTTYTTNLMAPSGGQAIKKIRLFNANAGSNGEKDAFFNNLEVCQSATDNDGDGWYSNLDCDDSNFDVNPNASEVLFNNVDDDCNPSTLDYNSGIFEASVILSQTYLLDENNYGPEYFYAQDLGTYYCGDTYFLQGAETKTFKCSSNQNADIISAAFHYRVYPYQQSPGSFTTINMPFSSDDGINFGCQDQTWRIDNLGIDLLQGLDNNTYILEVYTSAEYTYTNGSGTHTSYEEQNYGLASFILASDIIKPEPVCQDFNLVMGQDGTGILEIDDINNGSTDNCGIASMSLSQSTFTCQDLPTEPFTSDEIIISEYVNGSNFDNYIELFNGTPNTVDLANYELRIYVASQLTPIATDNLGAAGTLEPNETVVFCRSTSTIYSGPKTVLPNNSLAFQGRETLELFNNETNQRVDLFGAIGEYPVGGFVVGGNSSTSHTLRRLPSVTEGNINAPAGFPTLGTEWEQFPLDDVSDLGSHTFNYNTGEPSLGIKLFVIDEVGNQGVCTSNVTFEIPAPAASCNNITVVLDENGSATIAAEDLNDGSTASCNTFSFTASQTTFDCSDVGDNIVVLNVTDQNGITTTCDATVTVEDNSTPTAICQNITVTLDETGNATISADDIDNGSNAACGISAISATPLNFDINSIGANTVILTVTDNNGNISTCEATVTVTGNVVPEAVCNDITVSLDSNGNATIEASEIDGGSSALAGIASLNVSPSTFDCSHLGENTVTLTVTDNNGLSSTCDATVTVWDTEAPSALCQDATVTIGLDGLGILSIEDVNNGSSDNCLISSMDLSQTQFTCDDIPTEVPVGELIISEYIHGSLVNGNGIFIINNYIEVYNGTPVAIDFANYQLRRYTTSATTPSAVDPLGAAGIIEPGETFVFSQFFGTTYEGEQLELQNFTMIYNGSEAMELYNTTTNQRVDLVGTLGESPTNGWNVNGFSTKQHTLRRLPHITQGVTENLPGFPSLGTEWEQFPLDDLSGLGAHESSANLEPSFGVVLTVNDDVGNSSTCTSSVTFDYEAPALSCTNTTLYLDETGNAVLTPSDLDNDVITSCGVDTMVVSQSAFDCSDIGETSVTLTVVDVFENTSTCSSIVTVVDNTPPNVICKQISVALDEFGQASITGADVDDGTNDACGIMELTVSPSNFDCTNTGNNTVVLTATDNNGNTSTCSTVVTVMDLIGPTAYCQDITLELDETGNATLDPVLLDNGSTDNCTGSSIFWASQTEFDYSDLGPNYVELTVIDINGTPDFCQSVVTVIGDVTINAICQNATVYLDENGMATIEASDIDGGSNAPLGVASISASQTAFDCSNVGDNSVTLTVTDNSGNEATCEAVVSVIDLIPPTAICNDFTLALDEYGVGTLSPQDINNGSFDNCGMLGPVIASQIYFDCTHIGDNQITLTVLDVNGNISTCEATVTVTGDIAPVAVCTNTTIYLDENGQASITAQDIGSGSSAVCGLASVTASQTDFSCSDLGANIVTLAVSDINGNTSTCDATVTVLDAIPPTAVGENLILPLDENGEATIVASDLDNGSTDNCGIVTIAVSETNFNCSDLGANSVVLTATDLSGNSSTFNATVTVVDDSAPVLSCQNISIGLDISGYAEITASDLVSSVSDNCSTATLEITNGPSYFGCDDEASTFEVEVTATDDAGNVSTCISSVTILAGIDSDGDSISDLCDFCFGDNSLGDADGDGICGDTNICPGTEDLLDYDAECDVNLTATFLSIQANNGGVYCINGPFTGGQITVSNGSTVRLSGSGNMSVNVQANSTLEVMSGSNIQFSSINVNWGANAMVIHSDAEVNYDGNFSPNGTVVNCGTLNVQQLTVNYGKTFINNNVVEVTHNKKTSNISGELINYGYIHTAGSMTSNWNGEIFNHCHLAIDNNLILQRYLRNYSFINVGNKSTIYYNGRVYQYDGAMFQTSSTNLSGRFVGYGDLNFVKILGNTTISWNGKFEGSTAVCDIDGFENVSAPNPFINGAYEDCELDIAVSECNPVGHSSIPHTSGIAGAPDSDSNQTSDNANLSGVVSNVGINASSTQSGDISIWPNPTSGETTLMFTSPSKDKVRIELYAIDGSLVNSIYEGDVAKGVAHIEKLDMSGYENGIYFVRIVQNDFVQTKKIVFTR